MRKAFLPLFAFLAVVSGFQALAAQEADDTRHISIDAGLMVFDRRVAADQLGDWADANGGYFTWKSDDAVVLRVPDDAVEDLRDYLGDIGDGILHYGRSEADLREQMMRARSALEAREEILGKNRELLDSSDVEGTLELERELRRLMAEIDASRGLLVRLEHDAAMARIHIALSFRQQTVPVQRPSRFEWINHVDFYGFLDGYEMAGAKTFRGSPIPVPEGFAEIVGWGGMDALSPEGVRLRVRRVANYPEQTAEFWDKALVTDLSERGYLPVNRETRTDWGGNGEFLANLWALPVGNEDYLYLIGLRVNGKWIEVLELAGKAEYVDAVLD